MNYSWRKEEEYETEWANFKARSNSRTRDTAYKDIIRKTEDAAQIQLQEISKLISNKHI